MEETRSEPSRSAAFAGLDLIAADGPLIVTTQHGLGDTVLARAAIRELLKWRRDVSVVTGWPQLWLDILPAERIISRGSVFRDAERNLSRFRELERPAARGTERALSYMARFWEMIRLRRSMLACTLAAVGASSGDVSIDPARFEAAGRAEAAAAGLDVDRPFVIVRYPTLRAECFCESRNPAPDLMAAAARAIVRVAEPLVSVCSVAPTKEWFTEREALRPADLRLDAGELSPEAYWWLLSRARVVVTPNANPVLLAPAMGGRAFCVFGGAVPPEVVLDKNVGPGRVDFVAPDPFCACFDPYHHCRRAIDVELVAARARAFSESCP